MEYGKGYSPELNYSIVEVDMSKPVIILKKGERIYE